MKKIILSVFITVMLFTTVCFAQTPQTINDLAFMKSNWFTSSANYTYHTLEVGANQDDADSGSVGSLTAYKQPNTDVYTLTVLDDGIVTIKVIPSNTMYGTKINIEAISFVSDVSGTKKRYSASDNNTGRNGVRIVDFNGTGSCLKSRYLSKGTYFFSVTGSQYSKQNASSNDLVRVNYNLSVTMDTFADNLNSSAENPYVVDSANKAIKGILGMELQYNKSRDNFLYDTSDKIVFPAGNERAVKLTVTSSGNSVLKTIDPYGKLNGFIKNSGNSMVDGTKFELGYGETAEITATFKANETYSIELVESFPKEYTILYEVLSGSAEQPDADSKPSENPAAAGSVKPIIMLHTACDISPKTFDNRDYKIFVNGVDYTSKEGYMGHITNLPESRVGDRYHVRVEVEGYQPYEETVTVPASEYKDGNSVIFVNVNTTAAAAPASGIEESSAIDTASSWAKEEIEKSIHAGLETDKMMNRNFKENATREEFCELVVRMYEKLGGTVSEGQNPFSDTNNEEVLKAYSAGIISGTSASTFSPDSSLTREQLCVMIIRALDASGKPYELNTSFQKQYMDTDQISGWAENSVEILNGYKIINGNGSSLNPKGTVTKEMAVLMMYRAYEMFQ